MLGDDVLITSFTACSPVFRVRSRILFSLVPIISFLKFSPIFFEIYPASMSPKFPVGTENTTFSISEILLAA